MLHNNWIGESFHPKTWKGLMKKNKKNHTCSETIFFFTFLFNLLSSTSAVLICVLVFVQLHLSRFPFYKTERNRILMPYYFFCSFIKHLTFFFKNILSPSLFLCSKRFFLSSLFSITYKASETSLSSASALRKVAEWYWSIRDQVKSFVTRQEFFFLLFKLREQCQD